jgi:hypothetical protein
LTLHQPKQNDLLTLWSDVKVPGAAFAYQKQVVGFIALIHDNGICF